MRQCFAPFRAALLALVVLFVTAGFLGMHVLMAHAAGMPGAGMHGAGMGAAVLGSEVPGAGMGAAVTSERTTAEPTHVHGVASGTATVCDGDCPPSGIAHTTDCTPAPGVPAPVPPAVVVLARSDAALAVPPESRPGGIPQARAPSLEALSISRT